MRRRRALRWLLCSPILPVVLMRAPASPAPSIDEIFRPMERWLASFPPNPHVVLELNGRAIAKTMVRLMPQGRLFV